MSKLVKSVETKRKSETKTVFQNNIVYHSKTVNGWAIIILPENIIIDNYHIKKSHIHLQPDKHFIKEEIDEQDQYKILEIVFKHLDNNTKLDLEKLKEE